MGSCYQSLMQMVEMGKVLNRGNEGFVLWLLSLKLFNISIINSGFHNHSWIIEQSNWGRNFLSIFIWIFYASDVRKIMAWEKFELRSSGSFSRSRGVKFLLRDPFTSLENLGFMPIANYPPGPSPHHICVRHTLFLAQLLSLFKANFQASILPAMSWLRGLLRCPTCLEVASTCFRDTRSVIN